MKKFGELELGFNDAKDYKNSEQNDMFTKIFVKNRNLEDLMKKHTYFLVGDKGTGKTAYAVYLSNNSYKNTRTKVIDLAETDIREFIKLKQLGHIQISDYTRIWKIILLWNVCDFLEMKDIKGFSKKRKKYDQVKGAIKDYKDRAFIPEIIGLYSAVTKATQNDAISANVGINIQNNSLGSQASTSFGSERSSSQEIQQYQNRLMELEKNLTTIFKGLTLKKNLYIFVDSLDASIEGVEKKDYRSCIEGLAKAVLSINKDVFHLMPFGNEIIKVVANFRSDLFNEIPLHNKESIATDNSVFLNWQVKNNSDYLKSDLYEMCNKILAYNNGGEEKDNLWDYYFPWNNSFKNCVDLSMQRPRDLISIMKKIQDTHKQYLNDESATSKRMLNKTETQESIGNYYIEEAHDWSLVKLTPPEVFETVKFFFECINSKMKFDYSEYQRFHKKFLSQCKSRNFAISEELTDSSRFLQLLFELNFICYTERSGSTKEVFTYWCSRERVRNNQSPKVHLYAQYKVHPALQKPFNLGQTIISSPKKYKKSKGKLKR